MISFVEYLLPLSPESQPAILVENSPAPPPPKTIINPPSGLNLGSSIPAKSSGSPSAMPLAPRIRSSVLRIECSIIARFRSSLDQPASANRAACSGQRSQHESSLSDTRVSHQPNQICLTKSHDVSSGHGQSGKYPK